MANGKSLYAAIEKEIHYAAMWKIPFGTKVKVRGIKSGKETTVVITDRGPAKRLNRLIDLNPESFSEICEKRNGLCEVEIEVLS